MLNNHLSQPQFRSNAADLLWHCEMTVGKEQGMKESKRQASFYVFCAWCGTTIREDKAEDSEGTCLRCFYRILNERYRVRRRTELRNGVSDR